MSDIRVSLKCVSVLGSLFEPRGMGKVASVEMLLDEVAFWRQEGEDNFVMERRGLNKGKAF